MSSDRTLSLHVPRYALWVLGVLLVAPWGLFGIWIVTGRAPAPGIEQPATPTTSAKTAPAESATGKAGAWGRLDIVRILIEPPEEFILADYTRVTLRPWVFKGYSVAQLQALWTGAELDAKQQQFVNEPGRTAVEADRIVFTATEDFVVGLSAGARARIYLALGEFQENAPQFNPFRIRNTMAAGWLEHADIPADIRALTERLLYARGNSMCFSDEAVVLPKLATPELRANYLKALSRKSALLVELNVAPNDDIDQLVAYWGRGGRSKDLRPLLQSLARRPNGGAIDIVHLIPRFARKLLYTYPLPSERPTDASRDCHWTSFNFENDEPDERFTDINHVRRVLTDEYYPVLGPAKFGDLMLFVRPDGVVVHSCVYIADDIVFTKNGPAFSVPWLLSPLADVQAFYASPGLEVRRYRSKKY